jgi:hypothetical protein
MSKCSAGYLLWWTRNASHRSSCSLWLLKPLCAVGYTLAGAYNSGMVADQGLSSDFGVDGAPPRVMRPDAGVGPTSD